MKLSYLALAAALALAGCGQKSETNPAATGPAVNASTAAATGPEVKTGKGTGKVTAIDPAAGTVTLEHGPIPEVGWPGMTMAFKASPAILSRLKVGDRVAFDLKLTDGAAEVTAVQPQ